MQLMLSFAQQPSNETEPGPTVWRMLQIEHRHETLAVLARLIAKTAAADSSTKRKEPHND